MSRNLHHLNWLGNQFQGFTHKYTGLTYIIAGLLIVMTLQMYFRKLEFWEIITRQSVLEIFEENMKLVGFLCQTAHRRFAYVYSVTHLLLTYSYKEAYIDAIFIWAAENNYCKNHH